jgi:hypothetical protein
MMISNGFFVGFKPYPRFGPRTISDCANFSWTNGADFPFVTKSKSARFVLSGLADHEPGIPTPLEPASLLLEVEPAAGQTEQHFFPTWVPSTEDCFSEAVLCNALHCADARNSHEQK